jgi:hypothetical protein
MTVTSQTMTDEQRKSVALEYLKAFDNGGHDQNRRQHPRPLRRRCPGLLPEVGPRRGQGANRQALRRRRRHDQVDQARLCVVQLDLLRKRHPRRRGHQLRRAPGRPVARRGAGMGRGPLVRRLRDPGLPHPAGVHLPRPRLRGQGRRPLSLARRALVGRVRWQRVSSTCNGSPLLAVGFVLGGGVSHERCIAAWISNPGLCGTRAFGSRYPPRTTCGRTSFR